MARSSASERARGPLSISFSRGRSVTAQRVIPDFLGGLGVFFGGRTGFSGEVPGIFG